MFCFNMTIIASVGVVAVIDVVRSQVYFNFKTSISNLRTSEVVSSTFDPWPASLMSCRGLGHLEPGGMAQSHPTCIKLQISQMQMESS